MCKQDTLNRICVCVENDTGNKSKFNQIENGMYITYSIKLITDEDYLDRCFSNCSAMNRSLRPMSINSSFFKLCLHDV